MNKQLSPMGEVQAKFHELSNENFVLWFGRHQHRLLTSSSIEDVELFKLKRDYEALKSVNKQLADHIEALNSKKVVTTEGKDHVIEFLKAEGFYQATEILNSDVQYLLLKYRSVSLSYLIREAKAEAWDACRNWMVDESCPNKEQYINSLNQ